MPPLRTPPGRSALLVGGRFSSGYRVRELLPDRPPPVIHIPADSPHAETVRWALAAIERELACRAPGRRLLGRRPAQDLRPRHRTARRRHARPRPAPAPRPRAAGRDGVARRPRRPGDGHGPDGSAPGPGAGMDHRKRAERRLRARHGRTPRATTEGVRCRRDRPSARSGLP
ncbi:cupin domain-containing protein [Streptomyces sp. R44]|uniref:Cupin domain-containing protein n=1 Tax=Streptomyces sp. R44 TaxID=3238633 RepID=A0AB39TAU8_9ACTN